MKFIIYLFLCLFALQAFAVETKRLVIRHAFLEYLQNHADEQARLIEHAIITVSGSERNSDTYLNSISGIARRLQVDAKTLVIAPSFKISGDQISQNELFYSYEGWWIGDQSLAGNTSSFEAIDRLILELTNKDKYPNLKSIVLTGHSAGGHLVQRYALGSDIENKIDVKIKYIVANPGTYAYLNARRWQDDRLVVPSNPACAYNNYKYGLDNLNVYMNRRAKPVMVETFLEKDVTYFLGEADIGEVEMTCESRFQGTTRYERGLKFKAFLDQDYQSHQHNIVTVPNIGHTQYGMYNSEEGKHLLFEDIL